MPLIQVVYCTAALTSLSDSIIYITFLFSEWRIGSKISIVHDSWSDNPEDNFCCRKTYLCRGKTLEIDNENRLGTQ